MYSNKKGKFDLSEVHDDSNLPSSTKLLKIPSEIADIRKEIANIIDEINLMHNSVANLRPHIRQAMREELTAALNGGIHRS